MRSEYNHTYAGSFEGDRNVQGRVSKPGPSSVMVTHAWGLPLLPEFLSFLRSEEVVTHHTLSWLWASSTFTMTLRALEKRVKVREICA